MTSFAFILGVLPLYFATGAGALGRHSVGTAVVGGMLVSTILNLFFIPVLYVLLKKFLGLFKNKKPARDLPPCPDPAIPSDSGAGPVS
jgi:HAE1 family hydrophobic/amphiphilic exporter-1